MKDVLFIKHQEEKRGVGQSNTFLPPDSDIFDTMAAFGWKLDFDTYISVAPESKRQWSFPWL